MRNNKKSLYGGLQQPNHALVFEKISGYLLGMINIGSDLLRSVDGDVVNIAVRPNYSVGFERIDGKTYSDKIDHITADVRRLKLSDGMPVGDLCLFMTYDDWLLIKHPIYHPEIHTFFTDH